MRFFGMTNFMRISVILLLQFFSVNIYSQFNYVLNHFSRADGLPTSEVYASLQDDEGFMWFCTDQGVVKYNGFNFETFTISDGLLDNVVIKMCKDKFGRIWFIGLNGTLCYLENNKIVPYQFNHVLKDYGKGILLIKAILILPNGSLVISTTNKNTITIHENGEYETFVGETSDVCMTIDEKKYGPLLMYSGEQIFSSRGSMERHPDRKIFIKYENGDTAFIPFKKLNQNHAKFTLLNQNVYVIATGNELIIVEGKKHAEIYFTNFILNIYAEDEYLWVTTILDGVFKYKWVDGELILQQNFLVGHSVSSIFRDSNNSIWLTTTDNGVYYIINDRISVINNSSVKTSAMATNGQDLFLGLMNGQLNHFNLKKRELISNHKFESFISDLILLPDKRLVISAKYLYEMSQDRSALLKSPYRHSHTRLFNGFNNSVLIGRATETTETLDFQSFDTLVRGRMYDFLFDAEKRLIYANDDGVFRLDTNGKIDHLLKNYRVKFILNSVHGLYAFDDTQKMFLIDENSVKIYDLKMLIRESFLIDVQLADDSNIWLATNQGLFKIKSPFELDYDAQFFGVQDGFLKDEIEEFAVIDSLLIIRMQSTALMLNISDLNQNFNRDLKIKNFYINNEKNALDQSTVFKYDQNDIKIELSLCMLNGLGFKNIRYKINGREFRATDHTINILNLEPDDYSLTFDLMNSNWSHSLTSTSLNFTIQKPFWNTVWFYLISGILISLVTFLIVRNRFIRQKQSARQNDLIVTYQQKALLSQMKPHFIYNSLNSIQSQVLKSDKFEAHKYISKFGELIRKNLEWSEYELITIKEELELIELYVDLEKKRIRKSIVFEVVLSKDLDSELILIPPFIIQPIIENSIWHGINLPSIESGKITLEISLSNDYLHFTVVDNGIGIDASMNKNKEKHLSMSSKITMKRIQLLEGKYNFNSNYTIIDVSNEGATGTKVEFILPKFYA